MNKCLKLFWFISITLFISSHCVYAQEWEDVSPADYSLYFIGSFISADEGWLIAKQSTQPNVSFELLHTIDGAGSFESIYTFPADKIINTLRGFQMIDSLNGYLSLYDTVPRFLKTTDGGYNWQDITDTSLMKTDGPLSDRNGFYFINSDTGYYGGIKCIYRTVDGGTNWIKTNTPIELDSAVPPTTNYTVNSIFFVDQKYGWAACTIPVDAGIGMKTMDGGQNWTICDSTSYTDMWDIHFVDSLTGGMVGHNGMFTFVLITENDFESLSYKYNILEWPQLAWTICYQNDSTIWVSGLPSILRRSTDRGATFVDYDIVEPYWDYSIYDIQFHGNTGYAIGLNFLAKFVDTLNTSANRAKCKDLKPVIHPNPVSDNLNVVVTSKKKETIKSSIYSVDGNIVFSSELSAEIGENRFIFKLGSIRPGFYILTIQSSIDTYTKKIIKL